MDAAVTTDEGEAQPTTPTAAPAPAATSSGGVGVDGDGDGSSRRTADDLGAPGQSQPSVTSAELSASSAELSAGYKLASSMSESEIARGVARLLRGLTAEQRDALSAAKKVFEAHGGVVDGFTDATVLRFLTLHGFEPRGVAAAHKQLKSTAAWRRKSGANELRASLLNGDKLLTSTEVTRLYCCLPFAINHSVTSDGDLLCIASVGQADIDRFFSSMDYAAWTTANLRHCEWLYLRLDQLSLLAGRLVRGCQVFDCHGVGVKHVMPRVLWRAKDATLIPDKYYPELFSRIICVDVFDIAVRAYNVIKPLLSKDMQARIVLHPPGGVPEILDKAVGLACVPRCYGGHVQVLPMEVRSLLGYELVPQETLDFDFFPGEPQHLGGYHHGAGLDMS